MAHNEQSVSLSILELIGKRMIFSVLGTEVIIIYQIDRYQINIEEKTMNKL